METNRLRHINGVLFIIAMLLLITQTVNLGYLKWVTERPARQESWKKKSKRIRQPTGLRQLLQKTGAYPR